MKRIEGKARNVRELLDGAKFTVDFYQREYAWQEQQVKELIDDLTGKFLDFYEPAHEPGDVEKYGHYFLGSIVVSNKRGLRYIVDGQQRLTTLTLMLIFIARLQASRNEEVSVANLIYSTKFRRKSFNIDVPERVAVMQALLDGESPDPAALPESARNIVSRFADIQEQFPSEVAGPALLFFVDWLLENVHLVEIEAYSDEDAYTIFETMNDRGLPLSLPEMLKAYVLANVRNEDDQRVVNEVWKQQILAIKALGAEGNQEDVDFFKNWLRARHAETIRPGEKGAENRDYERIGTEFHRWIRDQRERIGLRDSDSFVRFVRGDLAFYARQTIAIRQAARRMTPGLESIFYNEDRGFTLQTQMLLAPLVPNDPPEIVRRKIALVADFIDIWLARRVWNFRTIAYSSLRYTVFNLTKDIRGLDVERLSSFLREQLELQVETFASQPRFRLHQQNYRQVRHVLARLTHWLENQCGLASHFEDLVSQGRARPFEIEHIWASHFDRFSNDFEHASEFEEERNRLGGLLLIQRGLNQSLGDASFEEKREAYATKGENLLARSLHPSSYTNNPAFVAFLSRTALPFCAFSSFGRNEQLERQQLYIRMAEWVWNPSRLDLDGEKPPVHLPIFDAEEPGLDERERTARSGSCRAFWEQLLPVARSKSDLHARISPSDGQWVGARRYGHWWNYVVLRSQTRIELYLVAADARETKEIFDSLLESRGEVEAAFGSSLNWQRLDDKRASRVSCVLPGGWGDERAWPELIATATDTMGRLFASLGPRLRGVNARGIEE